MVLKQLIEELQKYDSDLPVGGVGHFGEILDIYSVTHRDNDNFIGMYIEYAGEEPD